MLLISQSRDRESRNAHVRIFRTDLHRGTKSDNSLQKAVTGSAKTPKIIATKCYAVLYLMSTWATKRRKGGNEERQNQWLNGNPKEIHPMKMKNPNTEPDHRVNGDECEIWKSLTTKDNSTTNNNEPVSYNLQVQDTSKRQLSQSWKRLTSKSVPPSNEQHLSHPPMALNTGLRKTGAK